MFSFTKHFKGLTSKGDSVKDILRYWFPELIAGAIFISLPPIIDGIIIAGLKSVTTYGALGVTNQILHTLSKLAEAIPVAAMAIIGRHNGAREYKKCGQDLGDTFWSTILLGITQFVIILLCAASLYRWMGVPEKMIHLGVPFLQLRSFGVMLSFATLGLLAFMKAIKNTKVPMIISVVGIFIFLFFDYTLVLGRFGFSQMGLNGSAIATIIQYSVVVVMTMTYLITKTDYNKYFDQYFFQYFRLSSILRVLNLSWPIMIDKGVLAASYVWLNKLVAGMGKGAIASFEAVKNLERFAFLPAVAFATIIVFLVSNRLGKEDPEGANANIKKVLLLTSVMVVLSLLVVGLKVEFFSGLFDKTGKFSHIVNASFPFISILVIFDFIQLILAGALRGSGDVKTVMVIRVLSCTLFLTPLAYIFSILPIQSVPLKFGLIYSSFYMNTVVMGIFFMKRIMGKKWQKMKI